jgi:N utilization substance protein B
MSSGVSRRQAREIAFQFIYGNFTATSTAQAVIHDDFKRFCHSFELGADEFAWELVSGVGSHIPSLDEALSKNSTNWRLERMPKVDLSILRLALFEILHRQDIPKTVAINEAVELAKKFGSEDSPGFVNGILDKFEKSEA